MKLRKNGVFIEEDMTNTEKKNLATKLKTDGLVGNMTEIRIKITKEPS